MRPKSGSALTSITDTKNQNISTTEKQSNRSRQNPVAKSQQHNLRQNSPKGMGTGKHLHNWNVSTL